MAYLEQLQREIKDFLAPFSTIQLKKKKNHYYHTLLSQRAHKNNKATFASHPYAEKALFFFGKLFQLNEGRGETTLVFTI